MLSYFACRSPTTSYYSYAVDFHCFFWSFIYIVCLTMDCLLSDAINFVYLKFTTQYIYTHEQHSDRMINDFDCWITLCVCYLSFIVAMLDKLYNIATCIHFYSY